MNYPPAKECVFLKPDAEINAKLPADLQLDRAQKLLAFRYRHRTYFLGIDGSGILCGFRGAIKNETAAALLILCHPSDGSFKVFDARYSSPADIEAYLNGEEPQSPATPSFYAPAEKLPPPIWCGKVSYDS